MDRSFSSVELEWITLPVYLLLRRIRWCHEAASTSVVLRSSISSVFAHDSVIAGSVFGGGGGRGHFVLFIAD